MSFDSFPYWIDPSIGSSEGQRNALDGSAPNLSLEGFKFNAATLDGKFDSRVDSGTLSVVSGDMVKHQPGAVRIKTPTAIFGVRGAEFVVKVD